MRVLAQDPATARAASMPASALATGCVDFVLPPQRLAAALVALTMAPRRHQARSRWFHKRARLARDAEIALVS